MATEKLTGRQILDLPVSLECFRGSPAYGFNVETIRDYTVRDYLLSAMWTYWRKGHRFGGKYAFGGAVTRPILWALADADAIEGIWSYDDGGRCSFDGCSQEDLASQVDRAIRALR